MNTITNISLIISVWFYSSNHPSQLGANTWQHQANVSCFRYSKDLN